MCEPCCLNLIVYRTAEVLIDPNSFSLLKWPEISLISLDGTVISI